MSDVGSKMIGESHSSQNNDDVLYAAVEADDLIRVRSLLEHGSSVYSCNSHGRFCFSAAASEQMFRLFMEFGLNINSPVLDGNWTLAHLAHDAARIKMLARLGADMNAINDLGQTPIWSAVNLRDFELLTTFLECGANLNFQNPLDGDSLLHSALNMFETETAKYLVRLGIDVDLFTHEGVSGVIALAIFYNKKYVDAASHKELAEMIIQRSLDVSATRLIDKWTALHFACKNDNADLVSLLLAAGADLNAKTIYGHSPIDIAVSGSAHSAIDAIHRFCC